MELVLGMEVVLDMEEQDQQMMLIKLKKIFIIRIYQMNLKNQYKTLKYSLFISIITLLSEIRYNFIMINFLELSKINKI
jgi:hypothetical protein